MRRRRRTCKGRRRRRRVHCCARLRGRRGEERRGRAEGRAVRAGASLARGRRGIISSKGRVLSPGRKLRLEERKRRSLQVPKLHGQMLKQYQRKYNMEVIRQGAPPLPIPSTPEEDAALVAEGVLPPQAE